MRFFCVICVSEIGAFCLHSFPSVKLQKNKKIDLDDSEQGAQQPVALLQLHKTCYAANKKSRDRTAKP